MSYLADKVYELLKETFPFYNVQKEKFVYYKGYKLYFDFFINELGVFLEVQGEQHDKFIKFFHDSSYGFRQQKKRDRLKRDYCIDNKFKLILINHDLDYKELLDLVNNEFRR